MTDSPIEEIKNKLDIVDVVREYVNLEKTGTNFRAPCPFHFEKTPSFFVNPSRQIWRCFGGCNEGGDMFSFVMKIEGVEFKDALRLLASKAGVKLKKQNKEEESKKKKLNDIYELTTLFFEKQLRQSKKGQEAKKYLTQRKINEDSIKKWRIGYAPLAKSSLSDYLIGEGYKREEIISAGVSTGKDNYSFDRFRGRLIFPIFNLSGYPVGFGGRVVHENDNRAKYVNSPSTELYDKSSILYGLNFAKNEIRRKGFATIVEGYTDVILTHQEDHQYTVSSSGTALTEKQIEIISRYSKKLFTAFDMDEAGVAATKKGLGVALEKGLDVKIVVMPKGKDPADIISTDSKEWSKSIEKAVSVVDFYFENTIDKYDLNDPHQKGVAAKEILQEVKKIKNNIERSHFTSKLADILRVSEETVIEEMEKINIDEKKEKEIEKIDSKKTKKSRRELLEERIIYTLLNNKKCIESINTEDLIFFRKGFQNIIQYLKDETKKLTKEEEDIINDFSLLPFFEIDCMPEEEIKMCIKEIKKEEIKTKLKEIEKEMKVAEEKNDEKKEEELAKKFKEYSKKILDLK